MAGLILVVVVAYGGLVYLSWCFAPDPDSEFFTILNVPAAPAWQSCAKKELNSTIVTDRQPIEPPGGYRGTAIAELTTDQTLFSYVYSDYFGKETYRIDYSLVLSKNEDWTDYVLHPHADGGGNVGASAEIKTQFDRDDRTLNITIHQQFARSREAKCLSLKFQWDGHRFIQVKDTKPAAAFVVSSL